jgi:hypothetical protein
MLHNHLHLEATLDTKTNGRSLGTFWQTAALSRKSGSRKIEKTFIFHASAA